MKYTNLENSPEFVEKTINLIETSFEYQSGNSFKTDFYPLMKKENHKNCHLYIEGQDVVAHIGVLQRNIQIKNKLFPVTMYGGITVNQNYRGKGIFKDLFLKIIKNYSKSCLHLLWSEKIDLYKKLNFFPCLQLHEYKKESYQHCFKIIKTKLKDLDESHFNLIKSLYNTTNEVRLTRDEKHWQELKEITSSDLYLIKSKDEIINYFMMNKGQDLTSIIHEYGHINDEQLELFSNYGNTWSPSSLKKDSTNLFACLLKMGEVNLFKDFIKEYLNIEILNIANEINFNFQGDEYTLQTEEFLQGFFGPGRFKELNSPFINISGLDSI